MPQRLAFYCAAGLPFRIEDWPSSSLPTSESLQSAERIDSPETAAAWSAAGFTPDQAGDWLESFPTISPATGRLFQSKGLKPPVKEVGGGLLGHYPPEVTVEWLNAGFTPDEMERCDANHFVRDEASLWKDSGFACQEAVAWRSAHFSPVVAAQWKKDGIEPGQVEKVEALLAKGYSRNQAISYAKQNMTPDLAKYSETVDRTLRRFCHKQAGNELELIMASPYATTGRCYTITFGEVSQWLGPTTGLVGGKILVEFKRPPSINYIRDLLVKGEGAFSYTDVLGAIRVVPKVTEVMQLR